MRHLSFAIVTAIAVMAVGATSAQAAYEVRDYDTQELCPEIAISGNTVTGGCFVEYVAGPWEVWASGTPVAACDSSFAIRIDDEGNFYAVDTATDCGNLYRKACEDESTSENIPWIGRLTSPAGPPAMITCTEVGGIGGSHIPSYIEFDLTLGPNGELLEMLQSNNTGTGVMNTEFTNYDPASISITETP